jgi:hypothetical protein
MMPQICKLTLEEAYVVEQQSKGRRRQILQLYDTILAEFGPGDYGEVAVDASENRATIRSRLHAAAARRGLTLSFLHARHRLLRFRVGLRLEPSAERWMTGVVDPLCQLARQVH